MIMRPPIDKSAAQQRCRSRCVPSAWSRREGLSGAEHRLLGVGQAFEQIGGLCRGIVPGEVCLDYGGSGPKTWLTEDG
jgi:hypothetical protein